MATLTEYYTWIFEDLTDPRVKNWHLVSRTPEVFVILAVYLFGIYYFLPRYMLHREPYSLKRIIAAYNTFQVVACTTIIYGFLTSGWSLRSLSCQKIDHINDRLALRMAKVMWWHLVLRIVDLIETAFYVLRKKQRQVSALHVYHHVTTCFGAWMCTKYFPGGMWSFTVMLNMCVHVLMYGYYLMSSLHIAQKTVRKIKPILTAVQIVQLCVIVSHASQVFLTSCDVPRAMAYLCASIAAVDLYFFYQFFKNTYVIKKAVKYN